MLDAEYKALPRPVREHFNGVKLNDVRERPEMIEGAARLVVVQTRRREFVALLDKIRATKATLEQEVIEAAARVQQEINRIDAGVRDIDDARSTLAAQVVRGLTDDKADVKAQAERADLMRRRQLLELGIERLHADLRTAQNELSGIERRDHTHVDVERALSAFDEACEAAKLEVAYQRAGR